MSDLSKHVGFPLDLTWAHILSVVLIIVACDVLARVARWLVRAAAEAAPAHRRLLIWRLAPIVRLLIWFAGITAVVPLLVEPTFEDILALVAAVSLTLAFALKDYVSCVIAGVVTIVENTYQPGDWIEVDGAFGEVTAIGIRAVHIVTADDTAVIIPHAKLWSSSVSNASSGQRSLLITAAFYVHADHDGGAVLQALIDTGATSGFRKPDTPVKVVAAETPWGTRYKIKAYVTDSRDQFAMVTDLTLRGKERLRAAGVIFAQAPYAEGRRS